MDLYDSALRTISALVIVLGLMGGAAWLFRRFGGAQWMSGGQAPLIQVLATTSLGSRKAISLVSIGGDILIVGTGASEVVSLGRVRNPERLLSTLRTTVPGTPAHQTAVSAGLKSVSMSRGAAGMRMQ